MSIKQDISQKREHAQAWCLIKITTLQLKLRPRENSSIAFSKRSRWEKEGTHVVAMCSQQIATGVFNGTGLDVASPHCSWFIQPVAL